MPALKPSLTRSTAAAGILVALVLGFGLGRLTSTNAASAGNAKDGDKAAASASHGSSRADASETSSRSGRNQSADKSDLAKRYEKALSLLAEKGNYIQALSFREGLVPVDRVAEFFDLSPEEFDRLKEITASIREDMLAHEAKRATVIESPDHHFVCEVAADPEFAERIRERFTQDAREVVGSDGALLLAASAERYLMEFTTQRRFTFDIVEHDNGRIERKFLIETFDKNGNVRERSSGSYSKIRENDKFGDTRFQHLFDLR